MKPSRFSLSVPDMPNFEPRKNIGDQNLTPELRQIADLISVMEQKQDWYGEVAINGYNLSAFQAKVLAFLIIVLLAIEGPRMIKVGLSMFGVKEQLVASDVTPHR